MPTLINYGSELIRINTQNNRIEVSTNQGRTWNTRCMNQNHGTFHDLLAFDGDLFAITSKGVFMSQNKGLSWNSRYTSSSNGEFQELSTDGSDLLATTSKGLYYSRNKGLSWNRR